MKRLLHEWFGFINKFSILWLSNACEHNLWLSGFLKEETSRGENIDAQWSSRVVVGSANFPQPAIPIPVSLFLYLSCCSFDWMWSAKGQYEN